MFLETERDVPFDGQVGKEGVALEDHPDAPLVGSPLVDDLAADPDLAAVGIGGFEAGKEAEGGGLAAAARAEEGEELPGANGERDGIDRTGVAERLADAAELDDRWRCGHRRDPA